MKRVRKALVALWGRAEKEVPLEPASTLLLNKVAAHLPGWKAAVGNDLGLAP